MTEELRRRRQLAYLTHIWDDTDLPYEYDPNDIIGQVVRFFRNGSELVYPAKSYFVAVVYAKFLERHFGCEFLNALDDPELLPDDRFFVRYSEDRQTYDAILSEIAKDSVLELPSAEKTVKYAQTEFCVADGTYSKDNRKMQFRM